MSDNTNEANLKTILSDLKEGKAVDRSKLIDLITTLDEERTRFRKLDKEAATYVETVIAMRTDFDGDKDIGWKGLGDALNRSLDERDKYKKTLASFGDLDKPLFKM